MITYYVKDGQTLGYMDDSSPQTFGVLSGGLRGHNPKNGPVSSFGAELRPATLPDLEHFFRVSPKGSIE
jgi:hypothetical protein